MSAVFVHGIERYASCCEGPAIVTIGTFDGIHLGHQEILQRVRQTSEVTGLKTVLVTFEPHPRLLVSPDDVPLLLTTIEEKERFIPDFFEGTVLVLNFDEQLRNMEPEQFVREILVDRIGVRQLIVGSDHGLGKNRKGTISELQKLGDQHGFEIEVVAPVVVDGEPVSSSRIRRAMIQNRYPEALRLLGHEYAIFGTVEKGIGLGKKLGYPTANVRFDPRKLLPTEGVYACWVEIGRDCRQGVMFIGRNHFNPQPRITVEAHLFEFDRDLYDQKITAYPTCFIRENRKFDATEQLVRQIEKDIDKALHILRKEKLHVVNQRAKSSNYC
ncbi:MAG TPA: bifunctional riboflavin kinase/FAD synthetase [Candidatus Deferrimicrobium sp.]|nr:bifunctional riboflavin kinase/FAD synthetase [Candidatus Deferrimicrobium sp.]